MDVHGTRSEEPLERVVARLLAQWDREALELVDAALVDCAATAIRLRVESLQADRQLEGDLETEIPGAPLGTPSPELRRRRKRLKAERDRLDELLLSLRAHRDRLNAISGA